MKMMMTDRLYMTLAVDPVVLIETFLFRFTNNISTYIG